MSLRFSLEEDGEISWHDCPPFRSLSRCRSVCPVLVSGQDPSVLGLWPEFSVISVPAWARDLLTVTALGDARL